MNDNKSRKRKVLFEVLFEEWYKKHYYHKHKILFGKEDLKEAFLAGKFVFDYERKQKVIK